MSVTSRRVELRYRDGLVILWEVSGFLCGVLASWTREEWLREVSLRLWYPKSRPGAF